MLCITGVEKKTNHQPRGERRISQKAIKVKVQQSEMAVTGFAGAAALVRLAQETGLLEELDRRLAVKQRRRGLSPGTSVLDLMLLSCVGGACIDDLEILRSDGGLKRLLNRPILAPSTVHDFLRRFDAPAREGLAKAGRLLLKPGAQATRTKRATLDCEASFFASEVRGAAMSYLASGAGCRCWLSGRS